MKEGRSAMAHYDKFKAAQAENLFRHCERYRRTNGTYYSFGNQNIDTGKTYLNYNLGPELPERIQGGTSPQHERMKKRLEQLEFRHQKNNTVVCSWIITAPKGMEEQDYKKFFETAYDEIFKITRGKRNVISAYVHFDEQTPHMHYLFVPGIQEEINKFPYIREKLSASKLITRNTLQHFHNDMQKAVKKAFPNKDYKVVEENPNRRVKKSQSLSDYKKTQDLIKSAQAELQEVKQDIQKEYDLFKKCLTVEKVFQTDHALSVENIRLSNLIEEQEQELQEFNDFLDSSEIASEEYLKYRECIEQAQNAPEWLQNEPEPVY